MLFSKTLFGEITLSYIEDKQQSERQRLLALDLDMNYKKMFYIHNTFV